MTASPPPASPMPSPCRVGTVATHRDERGELSVLEAIDLPFELKRIYYIHGVPAGHSRGEHGHKRLEQVMICMAGKTEVMVSDGERRETVLLEDPSTFLHVPPGSWRKVTFREPGSVLCVLASTPFDAADYMHDYDEFVAWKRGAGEGRD